MHQRKQRGAGLIEWLVAGPIVLAVGLVLIQIALLWSARHVVDYAAMQAVRYATVANGRSDAIARGAAKGFHAYWGLTAQQALAQVQSGLQIGWISWQRLAPDDSAFSDFGRTADGSRTGPVQIPNANLRYMSSRPGSRSGLSVFQANKLRLQFDVSLPLIVPVAGPLIARISRILDGCEAPGPVHLGLLYFGHQGRSTRPRSWACPMYRLPNVSGSPSRWRLPVRVTAQGWMQTPLSRER